MKLILTACYVPLILSADLSVCYGEKLGAGSQSKSLSSSVTGLSEPQKEDGVQSYFREIRKLIKRKTRKLKKLSEEIKQLRARMKLNGGGGGGGRMTPATKELWQTSFGPELTRWQRRVDRQLNELYQRVQEIGAATSPKRRHWPGAKVKKHRTKKKQNGTAAANRAALLLQKNAATVDRRHRPSSLPSSSTSVKKISSALTLTTRGNKGSSCSSHRDCKPGLCCHFNDIASDTEMMTSSCYVYNLHNGSLCTDSCQCEQGLNCFLGNTADRVFIQSGTSALKNLPSSICKVAAMDDVLHGAYIKSSAPIFEPVFHSSL